MPQAVAESRTLTSLVPQVAAGTLLILIAGTFATGNNATGSLNRALYFAALLIAVVVTVIFLLGRHSAKVDVALAALATAGLVWGIATIERPQLLGYWEGFGTRVGVAAVVLVLFVLVVGPGWFPKWAQIALCVGVTICCLCDLLGVVRTESFFAFVGNNLNQINDMLAPVVGKAPDSTFIPEYTALYGWLFVPFKHLLSPVDLVGAMAIFLTLVSIATVLLAVWIVGRLLGTRGIFLSLAVVVPIGLATSRLVGDTSSIASFSQELPIRVISGVLIAAVGLTDLMLVYRGTVRPGRLLLIGFVCGIVAWNSQDFGVVAAGVYGLVLLAGATSSIRLRALAMWLAGLLIAAAAYPAFLLAIGARLHLGYVGFFVRSGGSLGAAPIQVPGPVLIVMPIIICSAAAGWALMRIRRRAGARDDEVFDRATVTLTFVGTWAAVCLLYYTNRAYAAGQLQTMLLPSGVCVGALLAVARRTDALNELWRRRSGGTMWSRWSRKLKLMPVTVFVCLGFSSLLLTTNPVDAAHNLTHPLTADGYTTFDLPPAIAAVEAAQRFTSDKGGNLTYLGESFNYVTLVTHVPSNALLYGFPFSYTYSTAQAQVAALACGYLGDHRSKWIVLSVNGLVGFGDSACGLYRSVDMPGVAFGQLQELK
ncbi:MAG: hypothetical protein WCB51_01605 [Candidatus Dormiibacterota bacterium]